MADIFISYSSKDHEQAALLSELLISAGLSVWIDKQGIGAATSWSEEIVNALDGCKAFVVMLSPHSIESKNVVREVALAFEKNKKILPLDLEPVSLPASMQYHLAGLQRTSMTNIDSIIRALGKLGLEATGAPQPPKIEKPDVGRKSLMILPFEDLSPTGDNGWFADGIATELIAALSNVKSLRVTDQQTTKEFKNFRGHLTMYAKEMSIRYFIQGSVRKFGDQIKITSSLLDIETGDHLWQDSMKGTMNDIFDIQEKVAEKVVEGLKIHLAPEEKKKVTERGTENAEAYELHLKGKEYLERHTREGFELAVQLCSEAISLDPTYAAAYVQKANVLSALYNSYTRDRKLLDEGLLLTREAFRLKPDLWSANYPISVILMEQGKLQEAESAARDYVRHAPEDFLSHATMGLFYSRTGQHLATIASYEAALKIAPDDLSLLLNIVLACNAARELAKQKEYALIAIPKYEKSLKLFPNDENKRANYAVLLYLAGRSEEAKVEARKLVDLKDGASMYNLACLQCALKDYDASIGTFRKAVDAGFRNIGTMRGFLEAEDEGIGTLKDTPEWEAVRELVEKIEREEANNNG